MAANRIMRGGAALAALVLIAALAGCGGGSSTSSTSSTSAATAAAGKTADADALDAILGRQRAAVAAYDQVIGELPKPLARMATYFRRQEQEHVDGVQKAMWGLHIRPEPEPETIDTGELGSTRERLEFLYALESATMEKELATLSRLEASWARALLAATVADQAQHLAMLRGALGAKGLATIPAPFENGRVPAPE